MMTRAGLLLTSILFSASACAADTWYVNAGVGVTQVNGDDYRDGDHYQVTAGYLFNPYVALDTGTVDFGELELHADGHINVQGQGQSFGVQGRIPVRRVTFKGDIGALLWRMRSEAFGRATGREDGISPYLGIGLHIRLPAMLRIGGALRVYRDVSGKTLATGAATLGVEF